MLDWKNKEIATKSTTLAGIHQNADLLYFRRMNHCNMPIVNPLTIETNIDIPSGTVKRTFMIDAIAQPNILAGIQRARSRRFAFGIIRIKSTHCNKPAIIPLERLDAMSAMVNKFSSYEGLNKGYNIPQPMLAKTFVIIQRKNSATAGICALDIVVDEVPVSD